MPYPSICVHVYSCIDYVAQVVEGSLLLEYNNILIILYKYSHDTEYELETDTEVYMLTRRIPLTRSILVMIIIINNNNNNNTFIISTHIQ